MTRKGGGMVSEGRVKRGERMAIEEETDCNGEVEKKDTIIR